MKLSELIETVETSGDWNIPIIQTKTDNRPSERGKYMGSGRQARVYEFPNLPGSVIKHVMVNPNVKIDTHANFINLALKHQDNPFFPQIYNAKLYTDDKRTEVVLVVQMEKLFPTTAWKLADSTEALLNSLGINSKPLPDQQANIDDILWNAFKTSTRRLELAEETKNPQFAKAIYTLEPLFMKYANDISASNMMIRLTSVGPHLVFVDPF